MLREITTLTGAALAAVNHWQHHWLCVAVGTKEVQDPHGAVRIQSVTTAVALALQVGFLSHDIGAGPAVPTAVAHFYLIQAAGALGEVSEFREVPAGDRLLLLRIQCVLLTNGTAAPWLLHGHFTPSTAEFWAASSTDALPAEAAAALAGLPPLRSRQMGTATVPTFTVVFRNTETCLAAEAPRLTHTAWAPGLSAGAPSLGLVRFRAGLLTGPQLPILPYFPRRALLTVRKGADEGSTLTGAVCAVPRERSPWGQLQSLLFQG